MKKFILLIVILFSGLSCIYSQSNKNKLPPKAGYIVRYNPKSDFADYVPIPKPLPPKDGYTVEYDKANYTYYYKKKHDFIDERLLKNKGGNKFYLFTSLKDDFKFYVKMGETYIPISASKGSLGQVYTMTGGNIPLYSKSIIEGKEVFNVVTTLDFPSGSQEAIFSLSGNNDNVSVKVYDTSIKSIPNDSFCIINLSKKKLGVLAGGGKFSVDADSMRVFSGGVAKSGTGYFIPCDIYDLTPKTKIPPRKINISYPNGKRYILIFENYENADSVPSMFINDGTIK